MSGEQAKKKIFGRNAFVFLVDDIFLAAGAYFLIPYLTGLVAPIF